MPIIKSAIKQMKQDRRRYAQNLRTKRAMRTAINKFKSEPTFDNLREAQSKIDTAAKKNVLSKQAAARRLRHLVAIAKASGVKVEKVKKTGTKAEPKATTTKKAAATKKTTVAKKEAIPKAPAKKATTKSKK